MHRTARRVRRSRSKARARDSPEWRPSTAKHAARPSPPNDRCWSGLLLPVGSSGAPRVDCDYCSGDILRLVAEQKLNSIRHIVDVSQAFEGTASLDLLTLLLRDALSHIGMDEARRHAIHRDPHAAHLPRQ